MAAGVAIEGGEHPLALCMHTTLPLNSSPAALLPTQGVC